ncbi:apolipoprotein N-acyltransferase [Agarivorans sp. MS3-6]|uniref:apolipoprotein N-acyltransferase n=1 Tax=Agarivorans sp. TSD2052 TaxID=2937286 RepID=UPI00200E1168|nr:apolipoprotein N-acyltransferase [Agarivorans sp. TSD2052]UPW19899.1 apolipoprotein N-acyltransferase [Agarivorans sp. TSD2052]
MPLSLTPRLRLLAAFAGGLIAPFAFAPFGFWPLMPISLLALIYLLNPKQSGFKLGLCYGLGWFGYGIHWVHVSMAEFGGMPLVVSIALMALLVTYLSLYPALACWLANKWQAKRGAAFYLLWFPACWLFSEWLRSWVLTGFPWLQPGYSQIDSPLSAVAPILGLYGVTWLVLVVAAAGVLLIRGQQRMRWLASLAITAPWLLGIALTGHSWTTPSPSMTVALVQGNVPLDIKWLPENRAASLHMYQQETLNISDADVIVWPESAIAALEYDVIEFLHQLDGQLLAKQQALITGVIAHDLQTNDYYNALVTLGQESQENNASASYYYENPNRYYKNHLLPIGEFVPFEKLLRPLAPYFNLPMSSFGRGDPLQTNLQVKGHQWLAAICYEIAFGELMRPQFTANTDAIITVSNDAWFGTSIGPQQHLEIAQMRALEFGRPVVRSTNTGVTAIIDRFGKVQQRAPEYQLLTLKGEIIPATGVTPYQRLGLWPMGLIVLVGFIVRLLPTRRNKSLKTAVH